MSQSNRSKVATALSLTLAVVVVGALSGCTKTGAHQQMGQSQVREQPTNMMAQQAVHTIGETSESLYDDVKGLEWQKAAEKLPTLKKANSELKASKLSKGSDEYVGRLANDLGKQIGKQDRLSAMESANQLTRASMDLGEPVAATAPKELSLLDYYGRELEIGAIAKDKGKLSGAAKDIKHTWLSLKPKFSKPGTSEEKGFDQLIKQLDKANSNVEYQQIATKILDHVDKMETMFSKSGKRVG